MLDSIKRLQLEKIEQPVLLGRALSTEKNSALRSHVPLFPLAGGSALAKSIVSSRALGSSDIRG